jgi:hypothetical protein
MRLQWLAWSCHQHRVVYRHTQRPPPASPPGWRHSKGTLVLGSHLHTKDPKSAVIYMMGFNRQMIAGNGICAPSKLGT